MTASTCRYGTGTIGCAGVGCVPVMPLWGLSIDWFRWHRYWHALVGTHTLGAPAGSLLTALHRRFHSLPQKHLLVGLPPAPERVQLMRQGQVGGSCTVYRLQP